MGPFADGRNDVRRSFCIKGGRGGDGEQFHGANALHDDEVGSMTDAGVMRIADNLDGSLTGQQLRELAAAVPSRPQDGLREQRHIGVSLEFHGVATIPQPASVG